MLHGAALRFLSWTLPSLSMNDPPGTDPPANTDRLKRTTATVSDQIAYRTAAPATHDRDVPKSAVEESRCDDLRLSPNGPRSTGCEATEDPSPVPPTHRRGDARSSRRAGGPPPGSQGRLYRDRWRQDAPSGKTPPNALPGTSPTCRRGRMSESPARTFTQIVNTANTSNPCATMTFGQWSRPESSGSRMGGGVTRDG